MFFEAKFKGGKTYTVNNSYLQEEHCNHCISCVHDLLFSVVYYRSLGLNLVMSAEFIRVIVALGPVGWGLKIWLSQVVYEWSVGYPGVMNSERVGRTSNI